MLDRRRRDFTTLLCGAGLLGAAKAKQARAQQPVIPVIGFLNSTSLDGYRPMLEAFNAIDVVDAPPVRDKWAMYLKSQDLREKVPTHEKRRRLTELLATMATDIGLTDISASDLERSYAPDYLLRRMKVEEMSDKQELERAFAEASANTTPQSSSEPRR